MQPPSQSRSTLAPGGTTLGSPVGGGNPASSAAIAGGVSASPVSARTTRQKMLRLSRSMIRMIPSLSREQVERYRRDGILFPVPALSADEVARFRAGYMDLEARLGGKPSAQQLSQTHLHFRWAYDLATYPAVLDAVEDVLGPDIMVWTVSIFPKQPRDAAYISWHQDGTYWGLDTTQVTTAWIALTDSTIENGCMRVLAGSHKNRIFPHTETYAPDNLLSRGQEVQVEVKDEDATDVV